VRWRLDGRGRYSALRDQGTSNVQFAALKGGTRKVTDGVQMLSLTSMARNGNAVGVRATIDNPADIVRFNLAKPQPVVQLTSVNADVLQGIRTGKTEEVWYTSTGGTRVQGWILKPPG